jgi:hypothetical protein
MIRAMGLLAALLSLALGVLLAVRLRQVRYAGPIYQVTSTQFIVDVLEGPVYMGDDLSISVGLYGPYLRQPPSTMKAELNSIKSGEFISLTIPASVQVLEHVSKNTPTEVKHSYLELPVLGPVVGTTTYLVGSYEWREPRWPLYGFIGSVALAPLFLWGFGAILSLFAGANGSKQATS